MNPKASTVEELKGRRKALHMGMCKLLREDLLLNLKNVSEVCALRICKIYFARALESLSR